MKTKRQNYKYNLVGNENVKEYVNEDVNDNAPEDIKMDDEDADIDVDVDKLKITYKYEGKLYEIGDDDLVINMCEMVPYIKLNIYEDMNKYMLIMYDVSIMDGIYVHLMVLYSRTRPRGVQKVKYVHPMHSDSEKHEYIYEIVKYDGSDNILYLSSVSAGRIVSSIELLCEKMGCVRLGIKRRMWV